MQRKRLGDVVVRAQLERQNLVDLLILGGQHDDRHAARLADLAAGLDAVEHGQHDVHDDEVGPLARGQRDRAASVAGRRNRIAASFEVEAQRLQDRRLIVDDQNLLRSGAALPRSFLRSQASSAKPVMRIEVTIA